MELNEAQTKYWENLLDEACLLDYDFTDDPLYPVEPRRYVAVFRDDGIGQRGYFVAAFVRADELCEYVDRGLADIAAPKTDDDTVYNLYEVHDLVEMRELNFKQPLVLVD